MAYFRKITCKKCGETKQELCGHDYLPDICSSCRDKEVTQKRTQHLNGLRALPIEERLVRIEKWIYDYKPPISNGDVRF